MKAKIKTYTLADLLNSLLGEPSPGDDLHFHKCGYVDPDRGPVLAGSDQEGVFPGEPTDGGCGTIWEHDPLYGWGDKDATTYYAHHHCPLCGKGPWVIPFYPEDIK